MLDNVYISKQKVIAFTAIVAVCLIIGFIAFNGFNGNGKEKETGTYQNFSYGYQPVNNFNAIHFPTALGFLLIPQPEGLDNRFTDMVKKSGVGWITFEVDPVEVFIHPNPMNRLVNAVNYAKSVGLKINVVQQEDINHYGEFNLNVSTDYRRDYQAFSGFMLNSSISLVKLLNPDRISVLAEPTHFQTDMGSNYSVDQWVQLAVNSGRAVKQVNSNIQVWVDVLPTTTTDYMFARSISTKSGVNGVGVDIYDHSGNFDSISLLANYIVLNGKKVGVTETFFQDIYAQRQYDNLTKYEHDASLWLNVTYSKAHSNKYDSTFTPFFSNDFVNYSQLPLPFNITVGIQYVNSLNKSLVNGETTGLYRSYSNLIKSAG